MLERLSHISGPGIVNDQKPLWHKNWSWYFLIIYFR